MRIPRSIEDWSSVVIWLIPVVFFGYLAYQYAAIGGTYTYVWTPTKNIQKNLLPFGRATKPVQDLMTGDIYQRVIGDPVYLTVSVPRTFESVTASVDLQNNNQPIIEMGLQNSDHWTFDLKPLDVPLLEDLDWYTTSDTNGNILFQRTKTFSSVDDFLHAVPVDQGVAEYHQDLHPAYIKEGYTPGTPVEITTPLRGAQDFKVYLEGQPLSVDMTYVDLNRSFDDDSTILSIVQQGQTLAQATTDDDGDLVADGTISAIHTVHLNTPDQVTGLLDVVLATTDDILITNVKVSASYLVSRQLFLADNPEYANDLIRLPFTPTLLTTNATLLIAQTAHPSGLQTIQLGSEPLALTKVNSPFQLTTSDNFVRSMTVPLNDVDLTTQGWMSFTPESFFDPDYDISALSPLTNLDEVNFIYAKDLPQHTVTETTRSVEFDLTTVPGDKKTLNFIFSAPDLDQLKADIAIKSIHFEFHRPPLTFGGIWKRLTGNIKNL